MARRNKGGLTGVMVDAIALLPWWVGIALALGAYLWLHGVAQSPLTTVILPGQAANLGLSAIWRGSATAGQYVLPFILVAGAGISAYKRNRAKQLHTEAANRDDGVAQGTWREFEVLVGEYFRRQGFSVLDNGGGGPDGGVDLLLKKGSDRYLVQCKQWRARSVGVVPVRELYGVMAAQRVAGGFVVTSGEFTQQARSFAEGREIQLINGRALQSGVRAQVSTVASFARPAPLAATPASEVSAAPAAPNCPQCNAPMVIRQARSGAAAGKQFWGCSLYGKNKCRGTRELA